MFPEFEEMMAMENYRLPFKLTHHNPGRPMNATNSTL
jgi:hypothetical protein